MCRPELPSIIEVIVPHSTSADMNSSLNKVFRLVRNGDLDGLKAFFSTDDTIDLNQVNPSTKLTPLMVACNRPSFNLPMIELLIEKGAEVDYQYRDYNGGHSALIKAVENGKVEAVKCLIKHGAQVDYIYKGESVLNFGCGKGNVEVVKALLEAEGIQGTDIPVGVLISAILSESSDMVQLLLDHGAQVNPTADGETSALMLASGIRKGEIVKMLLERGAKVDLHNESKAFALMLAARRGNVEVVKELLERGADVNLKGKGGSTALLSVLLDMEWGIPQQSIVDIVKLLLEYGADVKVRDDDNRTTIHAAIITKSAEIVKLLLDKDKDLVNQDGSMDLHNALMFGSPDIVQILLDAGADPNSESYGKTPLMSSVLNINTAKMLIDSGANVNLQDNEGGYAMLYVIKEENYEVVEFLLEEGADVSLQADNGDSVASILQRDSKQILVSKTSNINNYINNIPFLYTLRPVSK